MLGGTCPRVEGGGGFSEKKQDLSFAAFVHLKSVAGTLEEEGNYNGSYKCGEREKDDEGGGPLWQGFRCSLLSGTEFLEKIGL